MQEALNNIVKHSGASLAEIVVTRAEHEVLIAIHDNGRGFIVAAGDDKAAAGSRRGFGLTGLEERARMLGGRLAVISTPSQGTTIRLVLGGKGRGD